MASPIQLDVSGAVASLTLHRPDALNALDRATKVALLEGCSGWG
jgi:enoyl-CoA hydratase/carnithine racemase